MVGAATGREVGAGMVAAVAAVAAEAATAVAAATSVASSFFAWLASEAILLAAGVAT